VAKEGKWELCTQIFRRGNTWERESGELESKWMIEDEEIEA
jgi:hypothetical protein